MSYININFYIIINIYYIYRAITTFILLYRACVCVYAPRARAPLPAAGTTCLLLLVRWYVWCRRRIPNIYLCFTHIYIYVYTCTYIHTLHIIIHLVLYTYIYEGMLHIPLLRLSPSYTYII